MNLLSERLRWAMIQEQKRRNGRRVTQAELARVAGVSDTSVGYWLRDVNGMDAPRARLLGEFLHVDPIWLESGQGHPTGDGSTVLRPRPERRQETREQPLNRSVVRAFDSDDGLPDDVVLVPESRIEFAGGDGRINYELVEDQEPATYRRSWFQKYGLNPDRVRRFRVHGDSMEPLLYARDTILVNLDETQVVDGRLYALRYGDQLRVKYLSRRIDGTLILRSVNPAYKDEEVPAELANEHITIIGRVRDRSGTGGL